MDEHLLELLNHPPKACRETALAKWKGEFEVELHMAQLDWTLSLSPWERLKRHDETLRLLKSVQETCLSNQLHFN
jgi:hypothetical protein